LALEEGRGRGAGYRVGDGRQGHASEPEEQEGEAEEELTIELPPVQSAPTSDAVEEIKPIEPEEIEVEGPSSSELYHCRKQLYMLLLKAGDRGATLGELLKELDEDYSPDVVRRSLARLVRDGLVKRVGDRYVTAAALRSRPVAAKAAGKDSDGRGREGIPGIRRGSRGRQVQGQA
jgi:hypothetical protein